MASVTYKVNTILHFQNWCSLEQEALYVHILENERIKRVL